MNDQELVDFLQWGLPRLGLRWQGYRKVRARVRKKLNERLPELGLSDIAAYRDRLEAHPQEWAFLEALCRISISRFHRDRGVFDHLRRVVLPGLAERASERGAEAVRCWSAGCASGEEPYSLRILWERGLPAERARVSLRVVASDIDERLLERAREGRYPASSLKELPRELLETAFVRDGEQFRLRDGLRAGAEFHWQDIREVMPEGPFDLVLCRNLAFTYFDEQGQREVLRGIDERLVAGGCLVLGAHESLPGGVLDLVSCPTRPQLWQKRADARIPAGSEARGAHPPPSVQEPVRPPGVRRTAWPAPAGTPIPGRFLSAPGSESISSGILLSGSLVVHLRRSVGRPSSTASTIPARRSSSSARRARASAPSCASPARTWSASRWSVRPTP